MHVNIYKSTTQKHAVGHEVVFYNCSKKDGIPKSPKTKTHITI
jgi:hypothetical protein